VALTGVTEALVDMGPEPVEEGVFDAMMVAGTGGDDNGESA